MMSIQNTPSLKVTIKKLVELPLAEIFSSVQSGQLIEIQGYSKQQNLEVTMSFLNLAEQLNYKIIY